MANRFTDTDKWKKGFIRALKGPYKLLWLYICDDCNHAGIWEVDMEVARLRIGEDLNDKDALLQFAEKVVVFDNGRKWFIPSFIEFQYPSGLNPANKVHASVLKILSKYNLDIAPSKDLNSPFQGAKDKDIDKDKELDKEKEEGGAGEKYIFPFDTSLPDWTKEAAERNQVTMTGEKNTAWILLQWEIFMLERSNEPPIERLRFKSLSDLTKFFLNWIRTKKPSPKNGSHKQNPTGTQFSPALTTPGSFGKL